ncbi:MAG: PAS domain-containing protein [Nitrospirae bacterium]|nr:PAS domain-containing protein [Nitrospirota bacterium]
MLTLSQNKKIAISAIALFLMSFMGMLFFLENNGADIEGGNVSILEAGGRGEKVEGEDGVEVIIIDPETMYRAYLSDTEYPIFVVNAEGEIIFASDDCCELLGTGCKEFEGNSFFEYINTNDLPDFVTAEMRVMNDPKLTEGMGPFRMMSGEKNIIALFNAYPVLDEDSKIKEVVFSINDITAQVEEMNAEANGVEAAAYALVSMK